MSSKVSGIGQREFKFAMKACVVASLLAACGAAFAADAFKAGYKVDKTTTPKSYVGDVVDVSADYKAKYPDGISGITVTGAAFNAKGSSSTKYKWTPASLSADADQILVTGAKNGAYAEVGDVSLGGNAKTIRFETTSAAVDGRGNSNISLVADNIILKTENKNIKLRTASVQSSTKEADNASTLTLSAKDGIAIEIKASGQTDEAHALHMTGGSGKASPEMKLSANHVAINAEIDSSLERAVGAGLYVSTMGGGQVSIQGNEVDIAAKSSKYAAGINIENTSGQGADVAIGSDASSRISISADGGTGAMGVLLMDQLVKSSGIASIPPQPENPDKTDKSDKTDQPAQQAANVQTQLDSGTRSATILGQSIDIAAKGGTATGVDLRNNSRLTLGGSNSDIQVKAEGTTDAYGLSVMTGSTLTVNGKTLAVESSGDGTVGIHAQNNTTNATDGLATVTVNSEKTTIKANTALSAMSQGRIYVNGDLETDSKNAIVARGNALVSVNEKGGHTVNLTGDINFNYDQNTSGTTTNATVIVNLDNAASSWTGNVKTSASSGTPSDALRQSNLALSLTNGATWTPTAIDSDVDNSKAAVVNSLKLSDGVINLKNGGASVVEVDELSGTGGTVNVDVQSANGDIKPAGGLLINSLADGAAPKFVVNAKGITADDIADSDSGMKKLIDVIDDEGDDDDQLSVTARVDEGKVMGALTETVEEDGSVSITRAQNTKLASLNAVNAMAVMAWRHDLNDLGKRMGELRDSAAGVGGWVRLFGSGQEYGKAGASSKRSSIQAGADTDVGNGWKVGGAFTYTDGSSTLVNGSADNKGYGVAAYGTWMADNGLYVDLVGRYSRLSSDFTIGVMRGKSKNNAWSASAETGWHVMLSDYAFVEPQAELTYGLVSGDSFTTSNGVVVDQDDAKALIGRVGVRTGMHLPEKKGTLYARASLLHDFKGDTGFTAHLASNASVHDSFRDDVGGTYYEMGLGANFNWTPNAYTYLDLERQGGGEIKENWRWNVGFRYVW